MSVVAATGHGPSPITSQEAYRLDERSHGLIVFGLEGSDNDSATNLALWLDNQIPGNTHTHDKGLSCRLWVGTAIPCPQEEWRLIEAQLIECEPTASLLSSPQGDHRTFQIGGYFVDPAGSADATRMVWFRGKFTRFTIAGSDASSVESGVGYIKLNLLG